MNRRADPPTTTTTKMTPEPEYWRWAEGRWHEPGFDPAGKRLCAGVDVGSVSSQAVVLAGGRPVAWASRRTGGSSRGSAEAVMAWALEGSGLELDDLHFTVGTGYGRVNVPFAHKTVTEIHCHGRGAVWLFGDRVRTILDMGGQDCKAIRVDGSGKVLDFLMNDKCAAGTGRGLEVFADLLQIPIGELGPMSLDVAAEPPPVSSNCVIFAKSEATGLLRKGHSEKEVLAAYCGAMAQRVVGLLQRVGVQPELAITGGIAKNPGIVRRIERALGLSAFTEARPAVRPPNGAPPPGPQLAGALGAALFAEGLAQKRGIRP